MNNLEAKLEMDVETKEAHIRDDLVFCPSIQAQDRTFVRSPHCNRSFDGKIPQDQPAIGIASQKPGVVAHKADAVDLCIMAPQYIGRLGRWKSRRLYLMLCRHSRFGKWFS